VKPGRKSHWKMSDGCEAEEGGLEVKVVQVGGDVLASSP
jgi:hypothetical protein